MGCCSEEVDTVRDLGKGRGSAGHHLVRRVTPGGLAVSGKSDHGTVVMTFERPRFVIEADREWRGEWVLVEYAVDLKTAARRADLLSRKNGERLRISDRGEK